MRTTTRPGRVHRETIHEAGYSTISPLSVGAGVLSAYGAFAVVAAIVGAVLTAVDVDTEFRTDDWTSSGAAAALASAVVLLVAYLFGGYVAGRMARRSGVLHGVIVFVTSLVLGAVVGGVVSAVAEGDEVESNLQSIGIPTSTDQFDDVAVAAVIASLAAIAVGSILGGLLGERWHTKLARRVADPEIGPAADARRRVDDEEAERHDRLERDGALHRDLDRDRAVAAEDGRLRDGDDLDLRDDEPRYTAAEWQAREAGLRS
jgi:hypothetical protein